MHLLNMYVCFSGGGVKGGGGQLGNSWRSGSCSGNSWSPLSQRYG